MASRMSGMDRSPNGELKAALTEDGWILAVTKEKANRGNWGAPARNRSRRSAADAARVHFPRLTCTLPPPDTR